MAAELASQVSVVRLGAGEVARATALFRLMAEVFGEPATALSDAYVSGLLGKPEFWTLAATVEGQLVGGLTAHVIAMTRQAGAELFLYDIAVSAAYQRRGVGRALVTSLRQQAAAVGLSVMFVAADNEDAHALDFYRALGGVGAPVTMFTFE